MESLIADGLIAELADVDPDRSVGVHADPVASDVAGSDGDPQQRPAPTDSAADVKTLLFELANSMGMLRGLQQEDSILTLEHWAKGTMTVGYPGIAAMSAAATDGSDRPQAVSADAPNAATTGSTASFREDNSPTRISPRWRSGWKPPCAGRPNRWRRRWHRKRRPPVPPAANLQFPHPLRRRAASKISKTRWRPCWAVRRTLREAGDFSA